MPVGVRRATGGRGFRSRVLCAWRVTVLKHRCDCGVRDVDAATSASAIPRHQIHRHSTEPSRLVDQADLDQLQAVPINGDLLRVAIESHYETFPAGGSSTKPAVDLREVGRTHDREFEASRRCPL